jgi:hypothetical protein
MNLDKAKKYFKIWQPYFEINDKFSRLKWTVPESLLPIPKDIIEEVSNIIAKDYFERGDHKMSENMQTVGAGCWTLHESDSKALTETLKVISMTEENPKLKEIILEGLNNSNEIFSKDKVSNTSHLTISNALKIVATWNKQLPFNEKIHSLDWYLPESFLPYPKELILKALHKVIPLSRIFRLDKNDLKSMNLYLYRYERDGEAITHMYKLLKNIESNPELKKDLLSKLHDTKKKWEGIA